MSIGNPSMAEKKRLQSWAALCAEHAVSPKRLL